jgi:2'-5' RNA ligase
MESMTGSNGAGINSFALVSYFTGPLSEYLTRLRRELVADCEAKAHLTVLPPRPIQGALADAVRGLAQGLHEFSPVYVELGGVEMFAESRVVYVSVTVGRADLERMHNALNTGAVAFEEPFPYHPHITLAQDISPDAIETVLERARDFWNRWPHPRSFVVENLTVVQNTADNCWFDVDEVHLPARVSS